MRTHLLNPLNIKGREAALKVILGFDFHFLTEVLDLELHTNPVDSSKTLLLTCLYKHLEDSFIANVVLRFDGVRRLVLPEMTPAFYLGEVEIEDLRDHQLEEIRYKTMDYGGHGDQNFEVLSKNIEIVEVIRQKS